MIAHNELNRRLEEIGCDPRLRYILMNQNEAINELIKQVEQTAQLLLNTINSLEGIVKLHGIHDRAIRQLDKFGSFDGVDVMSTSNDPEDNKH